MKCSEQQKSIGFTAILNYESNKEISGEALIGVFAFVVIVTKFLNEVVVSDVAQYADFGFRKINTIN